MSFEGDPVTDGLSGPNFEDFAQDAPEGIGSAPLPDHETLIINDQSATGREATEASLDTVHDEAEEAPDPLDQVIASWAAQHAGRNATQQAYVAEHSGDPEVAEEIFQRAHQWRDSDELSKIKVFAHRSTLPDGEAAWQDTLQALGAAYVTYQKQEMVHPAELVASGQNDPGQLGQIADIANTMTNEKMRAGVLRSVTVRMAETDNIEGALATLRTMDSYPDAAESADEARVAIIGYLARNERGDSLSNVEIARALQDLSPKMQPWGEIKLAAANNGHELSKELWIGADIGLSQYWETYSLRLRCAIVEDLQSAGQLDMAERYATTLLTNERGTAADHELQTEAIFNIAHAKAAHNTGEGLATLSRLIERCEKEIRLFSAARVPARFSELVTKQNLGFISQAEAHSIALLVPSDPKNALAALRDMQFAGENPGEKKDKALGVVARGFAAAGDTDTAVSLAREIGWYPFSNPIKSTAYADIARTARDQRLTTEDV